MRKRLPHREHQGELNIVPYLDIMLNLVMFMLVSMTGFVSFQVVNVNMPGVEVPGSKATVTPKTLSVLMSSRGYYVALNGGPGSPPIAGVLTDRASSLDDQTAPTIAIKPSAGYDYDKLHELMLTIKRGNPELSRYELVPDKGVTYDAIVKTMDCTRGDTDRPLFPDVELATLVKA